MPCWELFEQQDDDYQDEVLGPGAPVLSVEAAASFGWCRWADDSVAIDHFGASAPGAEVLAEFGFTADNVAARARALLSEIGARRRLGRKTQVTRLHELYDEAGQSPWIDNLSAARHPRRRAWQQLVDEGIRGVTSNPTIFQKAIDGSDDYDDQFRPPGRRAARSRRPSGSW